MRDVATWTKDRKRCPQKGLVFTHPQGLLGLKRGNGESSSLTSSSSTVLPKHACVGSDGSLRGCGSRGPETLDEGLGYDRPGVGPVSLSCPVVSDG